jgi:hypothetical protein
MFGVYLVAFPVSRCHWAFLRRQFNHSLHMQPYHTQIGAASGPILPCHSHALGKLSAGNNMRAKWLDNFPACLPAPELEPSVSVAQLAPSSHTLPPCRFQINIHDLP